MHVIQHFPRTWVNVDEFLVKDVINHILIYLPGGYGEGPEMVPLSKTYPLRHSGEQDSS